MKELKTLREKKNLTQGDLANALGYTTAQTISNWERGASPLPTKIIPRLANTLGVKRIDIVNMLTKQFKRDLKRDVGARVR